MKKIKILFLVLIVNIFLATTVSSQVRSRSPEDFSRNPNVLVEQQQDIIGQQLRDLRSLEAATKNAPEFPVKMSPEQRARIDERGRETIENWSITKQMLSPPNVYYERFAELLKNENIHLMRLFIEKNCDEGKTVSVEELERCGGVPPVKGGGSFYSFRLRSNFVSKRDLGDIHYTDNRFAVGNDTVQTIIADIGAIHLLDVNLKTKAVDFLKDYKPGQSLAEIKEKNKTLEKGINFNNYTYANSAAVNFDSTYIGRSTAYKLKEARNWEDKGRGVDSIFAFKIVGRERDGSLVILWKELRTNLLRRELK